MFKKIFLMAILSLSIITSALMPVDTSRLLMNSQEKEVFPIRTWNILENISKLDNLNAQIIWDNTHGVPSSIIGDVNKNANNFIYNLNSNMPEGMFLRLKKENKERSIYETYSGIYKIFPGTLTYSENKKTFMASGSFILSNEIINNDTISSSEAEDKAFEYTGSDNSGEIADCEKILFDSLKGLKWAYSVKLLSKAPLGEFLVVVDAENGEVLYCDDFIQYHEGNASIFLTNPLKSKVSVGSIYNINYSGTLIGFYSKVENEDTVNAENPDNNFIYPYGNTHFEEANVYYHMNVIHDFFRTNYGYVELDKPMKTTVHYGDKYDNAFFSPWGQYFCFGDGNKFNNLAIEASVIYHEYTHALSYEMAGLGNYGEAGGMNEALSDYFGNTITDDPEIGEWVMNKIGKPYMRSCKNDTHYPEDYIGECHHDSLMFSAP
ncbi:MAG: hypothetical protein M0P94_05235, partial [Candidatus Absconditabacterales bacterium]|nr:hypothetical protein [Candidatus Absconditabacterales bacterium]